jgi:glutamyl-tRNA synthetase
MSVTVSESGGKLSKRERPKALKKAIKGMEGIDLEQLGRAGGIGAGEVESYLKGKSVPDMPSINSMAEYIGVALPEINIVDFFKSGYLPETMINFIALLGWNPGDEREIMEVEELIEAFDIERLTKSNSLFDRSKLIAFNTEHIRKVSKERLLEHFKKYLGVVKSPVLSADDKMLGRILEMNAGARTLADIDKKSRFIFLGNEEVEYNDKAVKKVLLKGAGLEVLATVREKLASMEEFTEKAIEGMLRTLAEERDVGLGKVAQPLRVAICGGTVSPPIFDSVQILGRENVLARIDITLKKFTGKQN